MSETFLFNIADKLLDKLGSLAPEKLCSAWGGESERENLVETVSTIQAVLIDAEEKQEKDRTRQLTKWLGKLKDAFYDAEDVLGDLEYEASQSQMETRVGFKRKVRDLGSSFFGVTVGDKIKALREKLDRIAEEKDKFHLTERDVERCVAHRDREMTHSFVHTSDVIGRDVEKGQIVQLLMGTGGEENVSILPIVGIGGLGKTTLAKLVHMCTNGVGVSGHFDLKMWVCVSEDFDVPKLIKEILKSTRSKTEKYKNYDDFTFDQLQTELRTTLANKKFLLTLDDVWNEDRDKWIQLRDLLSGGAKGSRIIVTTRSHLVALIMGTVPTCKLKGLSHKKCVSLFVKWAFKEGEERQYPNLMKIGEEIVKKCSGVPLAVKTSGSLLYPTREVRDWLRVRDNEIWKLERKKNDILPALRLSYNQMPFYLKQCFSFCSIYPKDFKFYKVYLIQLWMAEGLLRSSDENEELEDIGKQYVKELRSLSFLEVAWNDGDLLLLKMHDLVHDLALWVSQTECCTINSNTKNISRRVRHLSFCGDCLSLDEVPNFLLQNRVRTIFCYPNRRIRLSKSFAETCISRFNYVRVLDMSHSTFEVLPDSIGNLKHLRFIDPFQNRNLKKLPDSICKLQNLQTLRLEACRNLEKLPRGIGKLINLRFLLISLKTKVVPVEEIGCLKSLRYLGITECHNLRSLGECLIRLTALRILIVWSATGGREAWPRRIQYPPSLETLEVPGVTFDKTSDSEIWSQPDDSEEESLEQGFPYPQEENRALRGVVSRSRPNDILPSRSEYESLQQEITRLKEENRVLQDMVAPGRSATDEAGPSGIRICSSKPLILDTSVAARIGPRGQRQLQWLGWRRFTVWSCG